MSSTDETYRMAAREHLERAHDGLNNGSYYLAHYLSGLAIECHLRAWLQRKTGKFDSRHDLTLLAKESQFYTLVPVKRILFFSSIFTIVNQRWRSNHRYYSERQLFQYLTSIKAESELRGEGWKEHVAHAMLDSAYIVINEGEIQRNKK